MSPVRNQEENNEHATWISMADVVTAEEQASTNAVPLSCPGLKAEPCMNAGLSGGLTAP